jgi:hypothetical protein
MLISDLDYLDSVPEPILRDLHGGKNAQAISVANVKTSGSALINVNTVTNALNISVPGGLNFTSASSVTNLFALTSGTANFNVASIATTA